MSVATHRLYNTRVTISRPCQRPMKTRSGIVRASQPASIGIGSEIRERMPTS